MHNKCVRYGTPIRHDRCHAQDQRLSILSVERRYYTTIFQTQDSYTDNTPIDTTACQTLRLWLSDYQ